MTTTTHHPPSGSRRDPVTGRFRRWLQHTWPPQPPARPAASMVAAAASDEMTAPIPVPCRGNVFEFQVRPAFIWRAPDFGVDARWAWVRHYTPQARQRLRRLAVELAREYDPDQGHLFGEALNVRLEDGTMWQFGRDGVVLTCTVWCEIRLDESVRDALQPVWRQRIEMEESHRLNLRRAELVRELTEAWSEVIEKLQDNPFSEPAAVLSEDAFSETFGQLRSQQRAASVSLLELLEQGSRTYKRAGLYEHAESFDAALKAFKREHGLADDGAHLDPDQ